MKPEIQSPANASEAPKGSRLRLLLRLGAVLVWLVVAALILELAAAFNTWWMERHNAFILATKQHRFLSDTPPARPLQDNEALCRICEEQPTWNSFAKTDALPAWAEPRKDHAKDETARRREIFADLNESDRNRYALLNDELVLALASDATIRRIYGNWEVRAPFNAGAEAPLLAEIGKLLTNPGVFPPRTSVSTLKLTFSIEPGVEDNKEILLRKDGADGAIYAFMESDFRTIVMKNLPQDTPWDKIAFFRYKTNLRNCRSGLGLKFDTNNFGFRDRDVVVPKPRDVIRILCVGGSTTEEGPTNETTYPKLLERMLEMSSPEGKHIEVLNCGVSGMTTAAHVARLADYLELEPDMLLFYEGVNDIHRDLVEYWRTQNAPAWRRIMSVSRFVRWRINSLLYPDDASIRADIRDLFVANLRTIADVAHSHGIRTAVCSVASPHLPRLTPNERRFYDYCARTGGLDPCLNLSTYERVLTILNEEVRALCSQDGLLYVPVAESIQGGYDTFSDLYHMTNSGIERKAQAVFECLKKHLPSTN